MIYIYLILLTFSWQSYAQSQYDFVQFTNEWSSPFYSEQTRPYLYTGAAITSVIILSRESTFDKIQEDMAEDEPMGDLAVFGDYMGQLIPNLLYMGGMYWNYKSTNNTQSLRRTLLMLKTTFYSGLTTTLMKRIVNEKRPHGGDRHSFPSGHTTTAFAFASVVGLEHSKPWAIGAYTLATIVGLSRMNDNAHYFHDVTFGATLGISYGVALYHLQQKDTEDSHTTWNILPYEDGAIAGLSYLF